MPSSGDYLNGTHLHFRFGGGWGHFVFLFGLKDLLYEATYSSKSKEGKLKIHLTHTCTQKTNNKPNQTETKGFSQQVRESGTLVPL